MVAAMSTALYLDTVTAEVVGALAAEGVECLLLKGPAMQAAFYGPAEFRPYGDVDLLVPQDELDQAGEVLTALGFVERLARSDNVDPGIAGSPWDRARPVSVTLDLHVSFHGVVSADGLWQALTRDSRELPVGGTRVHAPSTSGSALIAVLHASTARSGHGRPVEDLRRAANVLTADEWRDVGQRLRQVGALQLAVATLSEFGHGETAAFLASGPAPTAEVLAVRGLQGSQRLLSLRQATSWGSRLRLLGRTLWPSAAYMRFLAENLGRDPRWIPLERLLRTGQMARRAVALARAALTIRVTNKPR